MAITRGILFISLVVLVQRTQSQEASTRPQPGRQSNPGDTTTTVVVAPSVATMGTGGGLTVLPPLPSATTGGTFGPPSITVTTSGSSSGSATVVPSATNISVSTTAATSGSGISIILNTQDCAQDAVKCPEGYLMSFCTGCLAKCTKNIASFSFAAFKDHMKIVTAPDGTNCTTNFLSITRQGVCRLGNCVASLFKRSSKLKLCPFGLFNC